MRTGKIPCSRCLDFYLCKYGWNLSIFKIKIFMHETIYNAKLKIRKITMQDSIFLGTYARNSLSHMTVHLIQENSKYFCDGNLVFCIFELLLWKLSVEVDIPSSKSFYVDNNGIHFMSTVVHLWRGHPKENHLSQGGEILGLGRSVLKKTPRLYTLEYARVDFDNSLVASDLNIG